MNYILYINKHIFLHILDEYNEFLSKTQNFEKSM